MTRPEDEVTVLMDAGMVAVQEGDSVLILHDDFTHENSLNIPPVRRAAVVARLRALADQIERGGTDG